MNYSHILSLIRDAFIYQDVFSGYKKVIEFHDRDEKFVGDIYNFYIREVWEDAKPRYYTITSPYDLSWKSAPQQALVFEDAKLIFSTDFAEAVKIRTGAMDTLFIQSLGIDSLQNKRILIVGSGGTAKYSYIFLRESFAHIDQVEYTNRTGVNRDFESLGNLRYTPKPDLSEYDMIFLHGHVDEPYLKEKDMEKLKAWVIITSYGWKTPERDIESAFFRSRNRILVDMHSNIENLKPLQKAIRDWQISQDEVVDFRAQLQSREKSDMPVTIFISGGTYIQNIAMMKYLMTENNSHAK